MKIKIFQLLSICLLISLQSCNSASASTTSMEETSTQLESYLSSADSIEDLLNNIQVKIDKAFISSIMSNDMSALDNIYGDLEKLNAEKPNNLINYWMAYTEYQKAICYIKQGDRTKSEASCENGISQLEAIDKMNSEDFALLAYITSFSIQFKGGLKAATTSSKVKKYAEKALELSDKNLRAYYVLGSNDFYTPEQFGGGKKAEGFLTKAVACEHQIIKGDYFPSWGKEGAYELLIKCHIKNKNLDKAKAVYKQAIAEYPESYMINQLAQKLI